MKLRHLTEFAVNKFFCIKHLLCVLIVYCSALLQVAYCKSDDVMKYELSRKIAVLPDARLSIIVYIYHLHTCTDGMSILKLEVIL